eukprot:TRINITY_DN71001_c0_g1_i1.p1 TRINITY_DN71001_c0_g1~~TRINITY_DN71001_c0_g1_i1.p1  ORF type:complete len:311 (-),score=46.45 TRINITY_DN71001_c0_g1_i1:90-1022(-)
MRVERTLCVMMTVTAVLTVGQLVCGFISNSISLLGDGALMAVDVVSYGVAFWTERTKDTITDEARARKDRCGASVSVILLAVTTLFMLFDALDRLFSPGDDGDDQDGGGGETKVDARVMVGFTAVNLLGDVGIIIWSVKFDPGVLRAENRQADENMNFFGALAHLGADIVRGVAVCVCAILALFGLINPAKADAYCSLFVCVFVLAAAGHLLRVLVAKSVPAAYTKFRADTSVEKRTDETSGVSNSGVVIEMPSKTWNEAAVHGCEGSQESVGESDACKESESTVPLGGAMLTHGSGDMLASTIGMRTPM